MPKDLEQGKRITSVRERASITQEHLAELAGLSVKTVRRAEHGVASEASLRAITEALGDALTTPRRKVALLSAAQLALLLDLNEDQQAKLEAFGPFRLD